MARERNDSGAASGKISTPSVAAPHPSSCNPPDIHSSPVRYSE
jgi:hypothetical protein